MNDAANKPQPITAEEVQGWFAAAIKKGKTPAIADCSLLADRLEFLRESLDWFPLRAASRPKKSRLVKAYEEFALALEHEVEINRAWETKIYPEGRRPTHTYGDNLTEILEETRQFKGRFIDPQREGFPSDLQNYTIEVAGRILSVWNRTRGKQTMTIGRATPSEHVLIEAMSRITGAEISADQMQNEIARSTQKKLLHMFSTLGKLETH